KNLEETQTRMVNQQKEIDKLTTYLKNSGLISGELTSGIVCLDVVVKNMANELAEVKTANLELQNNLAEKTGANATQLTQITNLQKELEQLETTSQLYYQTNEAEKQQLRQQISQEQQNTTAKERDIEQLAREKNQLDNLIKIKEEELKALQEQLRLTNLNNVRQIANLNSQINTLQAEIENLTETSEQIRLKLLELTGNFSKERIIAHSYRGQRDQERKQAKTDQTNFINQIRELKAINQQKQEAIEELENDQVIKDETLNLQEQTINALRENLNNSASEIITHCERVEELDNLLSDKTNQLAQVDNELTATNNQITNLESQLNELESIAESYYQTNSKQNNKQSKKIAKLKAKLTQAWANKQHNILRINSLNNKINNPPLHSCSPCPLIHLPEPHICPIINKIDCSHTDYDTIKQERDQYQQELTNQAHEFIQRLNTTFNLNLTENDINLDK
ncbi:1336_t:CDS:2, partial [Funneliformis geosporum]